MAYGLFLFRPPPGEDLLGSARRIFEADLADPLPGWRDRVQALADTLIAFHPRFRAEWEDHDARERLHLSAPESDHAPNVTLLPAEEATVLLPTGWRGDAGRRAWELTWRLLALLEAEGFRAYDPLLERVLDLEADREVLVREYQKVSHDEQEMLAAERPWWKFWG
jgi:hypothetical protein